MPPLAIIINTAEMPPLAHASHFEIPFVCNPAVRTKKRKTETQTFKSKKDAERLKYTYHSTSR